MGEVAKCTSWLGHKFEARFSYANPAMVTFFERATKIDHLTGPFVESCRDATYERDICVRCGVTVEHQIINQRAPESNT